MKIFFKNFKFLIFIKPFFSVSSSGAIIFAYLGEFLTSRHRARSIMIASVIFGILTVIVPMIAFVIINQSWKFEIPYLNFTYTPWRLFTLVCGIPNLIGGIGVFFLPESPKFLFSKVIFFFKFNQKIYSLKN